MVQFKNRYIVMEVFIDPNKDLGGTEPIVISQFNLTKAIKDSILLNFGECGLALSLRSFQGSVLQHCICFGCLVLLLNGITEFLYNSSLITGCSCVADGFCNMWFL